MTSEDLTGRVASVIGAERFRPGDVVQTAFVLVKVASSDGEANWLFDVQGEVWPEEILGALEVQVQYRKSLLVEDWIVGRPVDEESEET